MEFFCSNKPFLFPFCDAGVEFRASCMLAKYSNRKLHLSHLKDQKKAKSLFKSVNFLAHKIIYFKVKALPTMYKALGSTSLYTN